MDIDEVVINSDILLSNIQHLFLLPAFSVYSIGSVSWHFPITKEGMHFDIKIDYALD